jgi:hypothetical protein
MSTINKASESVNRIASPIFATKIGGGHQRLACLPRHFGTACVAVEHAIYDMMGRVCDDYDGGYWDFFELSNGGFYMAPHIERLLHLQWPDNGFDRVVDTRTAGIIVCAMTFNHLSFRPRGERFGKAYEQLADFIAQHEDAGIIHAALD